MKEFIEKFAEAVEIDDFSNITSETNFRDLEEWSSLASLNLIAMFDEEYEKTIAGNDIRNAVTVEDLYNLTK